MYKHQINYYLIYNYITKKNHFNKKILDKLENFLNSNENCEIKNKIVKITEFSITLNYSNFSYYETMKKLLFKINVELDNSKISNTNNLNDINFCENIKENKIFEAISNQSIHDNSNFKNKLKSENFSVLEIPKSFEVIGNVAHLNLREKFLPYKYLIAKIILDKNTNIKTVINKTGKIDNIYRTYKMEILGGAENFQVCHKEGNINFHFDIRSVYWCSRLQNERDRLLKLIKKGQILCDAFCGVGPLALRAAKQGVNVYANDLNPNCYNFLKKNIIINKIDKNLLIPFNMDAREFIRLCISQGKEEDESNNNETYFEKGKKIDHFYMNLPKDAIEFLDAFRGAFKNNEIYSKENLPILHVYGFSNDPNPKHDLLKRICSAFNIEKLKDKDFIEIVNIRDVSTKKHMYAVSLKVPEEVAFE